MVNGTEPTISQEHELTHDERHQSEVFFRVLKTKGYNIMQMSNIMQNMGRLLVEHSVDEAKSVGNA
jgi:hypothetical protein